MLSHKSLYLFVTISTLTNRVLYFVIATQTAKVRGKRREVRSISEQHCGKQSPGWYWRRLGITGSGMVPIYSYFIYSLTFVTVMEIGLIVFICDASKLPHVVLGFWGTINECLMNKWITVFVFSYKLFNTLQCNWKVWYRLKKKHEFWKRKILAMTPHPPQLGRKRVVLTQPHSQLCKKATFIGHPLFSVFSSSKGIL